MVSARSRKMLTYAKYFNSKFKIKNSKLGLDIENRLNENLSSVAAGVAHFCALRHRRYKLKLENINIAFLFLVNFVLPCLKIDPLFPAQLKTKFPQK